MFKRLLILLFVLKLALVNAQDKTFNNWHFGNKCGLTFNTNPPSTFSTSALYTFEGCSSISDTSGLTLFYTDGMTVYNKYNLQMPNGYGLKGHISSTQSALIVPVPFNNKKYYIFTTDAQVGYYNTIPTCGCLAYSIVDMNLNGGLGDVSIKNVILHDSVTEKLTGYVHKNDSSIWLISHEWNSNHFVSYLITPSGININPIISPIGSSHCCGANHRNSIGHMKISPDGTKIGYVLSGNNTVEFFKFDNSTGGVSNSINLSLSPTIYDQVYGLEFSPNSNLAYVTTASGSGLKSNYVIQFNLVNWSSVAINNSQYNVHLSVPSSSYYGSAQLAPDGKIYISKFAEWSLSAINNPDSIGSACNFSPNQILLTSYGAFGLPNHIPILYKKAPTDSVKYPIITVLGCDKEPIVPNIITPNNDGVNDYFKITCNELNFEPEDLILFNRWGQEIYNAAKKDDFNKLNDGTYFYLFTYNTISYKGYLTIIR